MSGFNNAPQQSPLTADGQIPAVPWSQWFQGMWSSNENWVPVFSGLTVVNGTGGATYSGQWAKVGGLLFWTVQIAVTGTATTASVANTTKITNLPFACAVPNVCHAVNDATVSLWTGRVPAGLNAYPPSWNAYNGGITISGWYMV